LIRTILAKYYGGRPNYFLATMHGAWATLSRLSFINDKTLPWPGETKCFRTDQTLVR